MGKKLVKVVDVSAKKPKEDIAPLVRQLRVLKQEMAELKSQEKKLLTKINDYVDKNCNTDGKGNRFYETTDMDDNPLILKREARKSYSINEGKAKDYLSKDPSLLDRVFVTVEVEKMDEDEIANLVAEGYLTLDDIKCFTDEKVTYATVFVKNKEGEEGDSNE